MLRKVLSLSLISIGVGGLMLFSANAHFDAQEAYLNDNIDRLNRMEKSDIANKKRVMALASMNPVERRYMSKK